MVSGVLLEPFMSQGAQDVAETPMVSKGLMLLKSLFIKTNVNVLLPKFSST